MELTEKLQAENGKLRERLSRLSQASQRINESLDFETVLQGVVDSARSVTDAKYCVVTLPDDEGQVQEFLVSGIPPHWVGQMRNFPEAAPLHEYLGGFEEPLRLRDLYSHVGALGLPVVRAPGSTAETMSFLAAPIRHRGESVGNFFLAGKVSGPEFTDEDEETLVMFASQAALVIANARRYRDQQRAMADREAVVNTAPVGVVVFDAVSGEPVSYNRETLRILGGLLTGEPRLEDFLEAVTIRRADGRQVSLKELSIAQALSEGETVRAEEVVFEISDGRSVKALLNATPIRSDDGRVSSSVVTLQDTAPMDELEHMRAEFLAKVSHELRAPLAAIKGSATTALSDTFPFRQAEMFQFLRIISEQADRMTGLINDLLDVARIETGTLVVNPMPTLVMAMLDQARNTVLSGWDRDNINMEMAPGLPPVMADPGRIVQVLVNLLTNAAKNSPGASPIRVEAAQDGDRVAISVTDRGRGVSLEQMSQLFRRSSQSRQDASLEIDGGGGWGLSICKGIVEAHGGRIWADSDGPDKGTRFTFTIPVAEEAGAIVSADSRYGVAGARLVGADRTKILVVDDDPQTLRSVRQALSGAGYVPVVTGDPNEALDLLKEHGPGLALLDLVLPGSDGIELMKEIFERVDIPVVFLSAYGHEDAVTRALDEGAVDYLVKPFAPTELVARIRAVLRARAPRRKAIPKEPFVLAELKIDYVRRRVTIAGQPVDLTRIEYFVLQELSLNAGQTVFYEDILRRIWSKRGNSDRRPLHAAVKNVRRKLGDNAKNPRWVFNEPRVGYRLGRAE
ncbi:MAG: response regulator [Gemmatimonadota bacterium]|nr:response regulator [Gemmatimonadota bacterium]